MNDLNAGFLLDIWHDLKARRLAPVAVGLVVALIAIPTLMMKGEEGGGDVQLPVPVPGATSTGAQVVIADEAAQGGSKLDSYEARDPFKGMDTGGSAQKPADGSASAPIDDVKVDDGLGLAGGGGSTTTGSTGTDIVGVEDTGQTRGGGGDPGATAPPPTNTPPVKREKGFYNFRLDVKFGKPGREKRSRSVPRMSFFTGAGKPIALFLGVSENVNQALFLVTPGLNHQGEGRCIPKPTQCDFMSLAVGKEHYFSANDLEFRMELLDINKVNASADKKLREVARKAAQRRAARGDQAGGVSGDAQAEEYEWPFMVDGLG